MNFDYDEITQKPIGAGYDEYKKFKANLIKKSLDSVSKLEEKISTKLDSLSQYLKKEIENILGITQDYIDAKPGGNQVDRTSSQKEVSPPILEREDELLKSSSIIPKKISERDAPRASCFPFFFNCLRRNKDNSPRK
jgi:hypothetical protein